MINIAIVAESDREREFAALLGKASAFFEEAVFVPINKLRIETGEGVRRISYKNYDIAGFSAVLPFPSVRYNDIFLSVVAVLEGSRTFIPYGVNSLLAYQKKMIGFADLKNNGFACPDYHYAISENALDCIFPELVYPLKINIAERSSVVEDEKHLKAMLRLRKSGQSITIGKPLSSKRIGCFVVGDELVGAVEIIEGRMRGTSVGGGLKATAVSAVQTLGSCYGFVVFAGETLVSFSLSPSLEEIEKISGNDITTPLIGYARKNVKAEEREPGILEQLVRSISLSFSKRKV